MPPPYYSHPPRREERRYGDGLSTYTSSSSSRRRGYAPTEKNGLLPPESPTSGRIDRGGFEDEEERYKWSSFGNRAPQSAYSSFSRGEPEITHHRDTAATYSPRRDRSRSPVRHRPGRTYISTPRNESTRGHAHAQLVPRWNQDTRRKPPPPTASGRFKLPPQKSVETSSSSSDSKSDDEEEEEDMTEEQRMMKLFGVTAFDTTKQKSHARADASGINKRTKRRYRQYMNRRGGFNRPLSPVF